IVQANHQPGERPVALRGDGTRWRQPKGERFMEITINGKATTLTTEQGKALWIALGYRLNMLLNAVPTGPKTLATVVLDPCRQDESDPKLASVVPGPRMDLSVDVGQAEALRIWKQLELTFDESVILCDDDYLMGLAKLGPL